MILDRVTLRNFGAYSGEQRVELTPPADEKPVVLVGGLNGAGKTTLLDAIQLALYGKRARCSTRGNQAYEKFLAQCTHRHAATADHASVEVSFRSWTEGNEKSFRVQRAWAQNGDTAAEELAVYCDGELDRVATEQWDDFVEELMPLGLSGLFLFDGEKIRRFAEIEDARALLRTAVHSLLGLELVDRLGTDLIALERRKSLEKADAARRRKMEGFRREVLALQRDREQLTQTIGAAQNEEDRWQLELKRAEAKYRKEGGELFDRRKALEEDRKECQKRLERVQEELRELAGGPLPLLQVIDLLRSAKDQHEHEANVEKNKLLVSALRDRDKEVLRMVKLAKGGGRLLRRLRGFFKEDLEQRSTAVDADLILELDGADGATLSNLLDGVLPMSLEMAMATTSLAEGIQSELVDLDRQLAAIPAKETLAPILAERDHAIAKHREAASLRESLESDGRHLSVRLESKKAELGREAERIVRAELENEDTRRIVEHSQRVRETLDAFRIRVLERNVRKIEHLVLESFRQLLGKKSLVHELHISTEDFTLGLLDKNREAVPPGRLSQGEKQLLAVSLLWGLARASDRPLPAVIDTPLGRLDNRHRGHLVERYLPHASHQVLLLSTDTEIHRDYFAQLKPWLGHSYVLDFDDNLGATTIRPGYFWEE